MTPLLEKLLKLFSHYMQNSASINTLKHRLKELEKISAAVEALDTLLEKNQKNPKKKYLGQGNPYADGTFRVYSEEEYDKLSIECLGLLHEVEKAGILNSKERDLLLLHITLEEKPYFELEDFKRILNITFKDKFTLIEQWWLQTWPFKAEELAGIKVH